MTKRNISTYIPHLIFITQRTKILDEYIYSLFSNPSKYTYLIPIKMWWIKDGVTLFIVRYLPKYVHVYIPIYTYIYKSNKLNSCMVLYVIVIIMQLYSAEIYYSRNNLSEPVYCVQYLINIMLACFIYILYCFF